MVPSVDALPDVRAWTTQDAKLAWRWKDGAFAVSAFGGVLHCGGWLDSIEDSGEDGAPTPFRTAKPKAGFFQKLLGRAPKPRVPSSSADPSALAGTTLTTEDDVLHLRHVPRRAFEPAITRAVSARAARA